MKHKFSITLHNEGGIIKSKGWHGFISPEAALRYDAFRLSHHTICKDGKSDSAISNIVSGMDQILDNTAPEDVYIIQRYHSINNNGVKQLSKLAYVITKKEKDNLSFGEIGEQLGLNTHGAMRTYERAVVRERLHGPWGRRVTEDPHKEYLDQLREDGLL